MLFSYEPDDGDPREALLKVEEEFSAAVTAEIERIAFRAANLWWDSLTASGDQAVFEIIPIDWSGFVDDTLLQAFSSLHGKGAVSAYLRANRVIKGKITRGIPYETTFDYATVVNQEAVEYARGMRSRLVDVGDHLWNDVRAQVTSAVETGDVRERLTDAIMKVSRFSSYRAQMISRTEVTRAFNAGTISGSRSLGDFGPVEKVWITGLDERVRETHRAAEGQSVPMNSMFSVGSSYMDHPGSDGPAEEVINCRCSMLLLHPGDVRPNGTIVPERGSEADPPVFAEPDLPQGLDPIEHSLSRHIGPDGKLTAERRALHDRIINERLEGFEPQQNREMMILGGGGGAGKTSTSKKGFFQEPDGRVTINSDELKLEFPEAQVLVSRLDKEVTDANLYWAQLTHRESSYVAERMRVEAMNRRLNFTLDGTGSDIRKVNDQLLAAQAGGYRTTAAYVSIDIQDGVRRVDNRWQKALVEKDWENARLIPEDVVTAAHVNANVAWRSVSQKVDQAWLVDNTDFKPTTIATALGGKVEVMDEGLWDRYLTTRQAVPS